MSKEEVRPKESFETRIRQSRAATRATANTNPHKQSNNNTGGGNTLVPASTTSIYITIVVTSSNVNEEV